MMKMPLLQFPVKRQSLAAVLACLGFASAAFAGVEQTVNDLIPKLAAEKVEDRYAPQMELQGLALNAARPGAETERAELAQILAAKATDPTVPQPARVWLVRQIGYIGSAESVAALTALLAGPDAELKECARRALEKNSAPAATDSLRAALEKGGEPAWRIGLIQSLGERGDAKSAALIAPGLKSKETALAASAALGKLATDEAVAALWAAYGEGVPGAADGLVTAGNRLLSAGKNPAAKDLFERLYLTGATASSSGATPSTQAPPAPAQVRSAALIGLAAADSKSALPFMVGALEGSAPSLQLAAVTAATVAYGQAGVSAALVPLLPKLSPTAKTYVLRTLDAAAEGQIIAAAGDADASVQSAALERLGQVGSAAGIPVLFQAATIGGANAKKAAAALARISGPGAGAAIAKLAGEGDAKSRAVAIQALAQRNDSSVLPALLTYAGEADPEVSRAACAALAKLGSDSQLDGLIQLVLAGKAPGAAAALQAVAGRAADKSAAARKLIAQTQSAAPRQLAPLFEALALLGGNEALTAVSSFAGGSNEEVKDAAIRALANWPDFSAHKALLVITFDPNTQRVHSVLAIQAIARLVQSADKEPAADRLKAAQTAMKSAKRDEEKKLLLSAFASVPDAKAADAIKPFLNYPNLKNEAGLAAMTLAEALPKANRPVARSLAQAVKEAGASAEITQRADALLNKLGSQ
jgi:HEAT repeat protein